MISNETLNLLRKYSEKHLEEVVDGNGIFAAFRNGKEDNRMKLLYSQYKSLAMIFHISDLGNLVNTLLNSKESRLTNDAKIQLKRLKEDTRIVDLDIFDGTQVYYQADNTLTMNIEPSDYQKYGLPQPMKYEQLLNKINDYFDYLEKADSPNIQDYMASNRVKRIHRNIYHAKSKVKHLKVKYNKDTKTYDY